MRKYKLCVQICAHLRTINGTTTGYFCATYASKFDRCKRAHDRRPQIIEEIRTNEKRILAERGVPFELLELEPYENVSEEEGDAILKEIKKALGGEEKEEDTSGGQ
jgi:hypothetical protein